MASTSVEASIREEAEVSTPVQFCTLGDDDEDADAPAPCLDEFDMWERQQQTASSASGTAADKERITALQKLFLEELNSGGDINGAAAKALMRLLQTPASLESKDEQPDTPSTTPSDTSEVRFMNLCDDDEDFAGDGDEMDEFDMWEQLQAAKENSKSTSSRQAITQLQTMFLAELTDETDVNAAAAKALLQMAAARRSKAAAADESAPATASSAEACADAKPAAGTAAAADKKKLVAGSFQAIFEAELAACGDANLAAAQALRKMRSRGGAGNKTAAQGGYASQPPAASVTREQSHNREKAAAQARRQKTLEALRHKLASEVASSEDASGAVAALLLRMKKKATAAHKVNKEDEPATAILVSSSS
eukprot:TRINITY_DN47315_c0_g1_i1.p1 TRINITY_DN47315_c0_g1~~TRINITY_DN47315_c0_g1_i1.p1  ORF type:complete len:366 (-),score=153.03 TRINITY_DN47315_c0_g1_i1:462-1559(-)